MTRSVHETTFGVELHLSDRCFVVEEEGGHRKGTIVKISDDGLLVRVSLDDGECKDVTPDELTLSFALHHENEKRRGLT